MLLGWIWGVGTGGDRPIRHYSISKQRFGQDCSYLKHMHATSSTHLSLT